ncbi:DNA repair protein XRCC4 [Rhynchospora pubera]|uniref:DNA repair protein XRCC4 n=1 Tax=Rhynchospora pubera TaxID=906938 RepID=A0AAV8HR84_9POAL|nr:DNA repair protein XRCC4 [Rhynchospora pubera]KAJ4764646.1 DNA repair protein XRCC4 [Rhynchospora pubera]KAJ4793530.1 DNA repair protein XRCC4 [Rhynchospora pubera]KAJ4817352.1 DNA repair protein XRCC4 [Rhynchospora pubera]
MAVRHSCAKLELAVEDPKEETGMIFVKATWHPSKFSLAVTDGNDAWFCHASEGEVKLRAEQWDQPVSEYLSLVERYLGLQQPGSNYSFEDAGNGQRRLSWTFERQGTKLEWRWKLQPSPDKKKTTAQVLDFLLDANIRLSDEVVRKTQAFEKLKQEAERCLQQSEKFKNEKAEFESAVYSKFVAVLNSKKAKLRELRDQVGRPESKGKSPVKDEGGGEEEEELDRSSENTELYEGTDEEHTTNNSKEEAMQIDPEEREEASDEGTSKKVATSRGRGRGRKKTRS